MDMRTQKELEVLTERLIGNYGKGRVSEILAYLRPDIMWIGAADGNYLKGAGAVRDYLLRMNRPAWRIDWSDFCAIEWGQENGGLVAGRMLVSSDKEGGHQMQRLQQVTCFWGREGMGWKLYHIHISSQPLLSEGGSEKPLEVLDCQNRLVFLRTDEVLYAEARNNRVLFCCLRRDVEARGMLTRFAALWPETFLRIHRSYLVNKGFVSRICRYRLTLVNGDELPIPEKRYREVKERLCSSGVGDSPDMISDSP